MTIVKIFHILINIDSIRTVILKGTNLCAAFTKLIDRNRRNAVFRLWDRQHHITGFSLPVFF